MDANKSIDMFFTNFFDKEECLFNFDAIENVVPVSAVLKKDGSYEKVHITEHIKNDRDMKQYAKHRYEAINCGGEGKNSIHGIKGGAKRFTSWFEDDFEASGFIEFFLRRELSKKTSRFKRWLSNKSLNWGDVSNSRHIERLAFNECTGFLIDSEYSESKVFSCHAITFIFEYTASNSDGDFIIYCAYPSFSADDANRAKKIKNLRNK